MVAVQRAGDSTDGPARRAYTNGHASVDAAGGKVVKDVSRVSGWDALRRLEIVLLKLTVLQKFTF